MRTLAAILVLVASTRTPYAAPQGDHALTVESATRTLVGFLHHIHEYALPIVAAVAALALISIFTASMFGKFDWPGLYTVLGIGALLTYSGIIVGHFVGSGDLHIALAEYSKGAPLALDAIPSDGTPEPSPEPPPTNLVDLLVCAAARQCNVGIAEFRDPLGIANDADGDGKISVDERTEALFREYYRKVNRALQASIKEQHAITKSIVGLRRELAEQDGFVLEEEPGPIEQIKQALKEITGPRIIPPEKVATIQRLRKLMKRYEAYNQAEAVQSQYKKASLALEIALFDESASIDFANEPKPCAFRLTHQGRTDTLPLGGPGATHCPV